MRVAARAAVTQRVLITGGAGFIGSHLVDQLLALNWEVRVLDNLTPQVHGDHCESPEYLSRDAELVRGDVRDPEAVRRALRGVDSVVHLAALVGVGQSMYELAAYTSVNNLGTAVLLEELIRNPVQRLLVASSMSIYGEGRYRTTSGRIVDSAEREPARIASRMWDPLGDDGEALEPVPTPESKPPQLQSVYALSKYDQERMCLMVGRAYQIPTVALRFFNVYGPRQALSNPYTGVLAIFASRLLNGRPPLIFEDGWQQRDFVSVQDVARACCLALVVPGAAGQVFNIGSGQARTVRSIATALGEVLGRPELEPDITQQYRAGDIRHCFADIGHARRVLGFAPEVEFASGMRELAAWLATQSAQDRSAEAREQLLARGLAI
jgi:dTDP-L-rhamnose 4-epimerase